MTKLDCGCSTEGAVCLDHALPSNSCEHDPAWEIDGRYLSVCCGAPEIGHVDDHHVKQGIPPTGYCGRCSDNTVFDVECRVCGEIVEFPR